MCATLGVPLAKERCAAAQCELDIGRSSKQTYIMIGFEDLKVHLVGVQIGWT